MKAIFFVVITTMLLVSCSQFSETNGSPQSNADAEKKAEQLNNDDIVPDAAADTPQNQNNGNKPKVISF
jgi:PBP1b-binding outer membrane lipoprotein LpoB